MTGGAAPDAAVAGYALSRGAAGEEVPSVGVLSRTLAREAGVRVTWFGFAPGEELTEHTSTRPALLLFLRGRARLGLGGDVVEVEAGDHLLMEAGLRHSVTALEPLVFVLTLLPGGSAA